MAFQNASNGKVSLILVLVVLLAMAILTTSVDMEDTIEDSLE